MEKIVIGDYSFGDGSPRIAVPLIGRTTEELLEHAGKIKEELIRLDSEYASYPELKVTVIEFRADYFEALFDTEELMSVLHSIREMFSDRLILFTFRSEEEGGEFRHDRVGSNIVPLYEKVLSTGFIDMVDVEVRRGNYKVARLANMAHEQGAKVVMSYHDFQRTPHDNEIEEIIRSMEILGADILKLAVMPRNEFDVRRMLELQERLDKETFKPLTIISMGDIGLVSRFKGKETGACLTFASIGEGSAPGQIEAADLIALLKNQI